MLKSASLKMDCWGTALIIDLCLDIEPLTTTHRLWPSKQFLIHWIDPPSKSYLSSLETRMWCGTMSKALHKPKWMTSTVLPLSTRLNQINNSISFYHVLLLNSHIISSCLKPVFQYFYELSWKRELIFFQKLLESSVYPSWHRIKIYLIPRLFKNKVTVNDLYMHFNS